LWAAHSVHHQSQHYNLSTALRQTSSGVLLGWLFYLPMAVSGVPPLIFGIVALINLLYQFWVHTEQIGRLGWFDRVFCSPSNHRVHHAVNNRYLDKNYGGMLVLWDRLFGTFEAEADAEPCVYGTRRPLNSWDPLWANAQVYWALLSDSWRAQRWSDKLRVWLMPPGWRPADVAMRWPQPKFDIAQLEVFDGSTTSIESLVSNGSSKPPAQWVDRDIDSAMMQLASSAHDFRRAETLAPLRDRSSTRRSIGVVFGIGRGKEITATVDIDEKHSATVSRLAAQLVVSLQQQTKDIQLAALAEAGALLFERQIIEAP